MTPEQAQADIDRMVSSGQLSKADLERATSMAQQLLSQLR